MTAVLFNVLTVGAGSIIGMFLKRGIPGKVTEALMTGVGLCVLYIGISGALKGTNTLVLIVSMALGALIGTLLDIDDKLNRLAHFVEKRFNGQDKDISIAEGFVAGSLLFCIGAMTIVGSFRQA